MVKDIVDANLLSEFNISLFSNPFASYVAYYDDNKIIGYIEYNILYDRAELVNVLVKPEFRNKKIGSAMLEYLISSLDKKNIFNITLEVNVNNEYAIKLYEKFKFKEVAIRKGYYNGIDGILMELIL